MEYKLIAFDMDGTLLNSNKKISKRTLEAIDDAVSKGKIVILNTGRNPAELQEFYDVLPKVRYLNCVSGGLVYDRYEDEIIFSQCMDIDTIKQLFEITSLEDTFIHILTKKSIVQKDKVPRMDHYLMGVYQEMYERVTDKYDDLKKTYFEKPFPVNKFNVYHTDSKARQRTIERITKQNLPVELAKAEESSLEITSKGIHKGIGLKKLCEHLNIPLQQTVVVGDAHNDVEALKVAGKAIVMANASDEIKKYADEIVNDCDHDGCVEVIYHYLLG